MRFSSASSFTLLVAAFAAGCESTPAPTTDASAAADVVNPTDVQATTDVVNPTDVQATTDVVNPTDAPAPQDVPSMVTEGTILVNNVSPRDIGLGGGFVYFTESNVVRRVPIGGGAAEQVYTTGSNSIATEAVDADEARVVWTERDANSTVRGAAKWCPHAGCGAMANTIQNPGESTGRVAVRGDVVAWLSPSLHSLVARIGMQGFIVRPPSGNLERTSPTDVVIEGGDIFWTTGGLSVAMRPGTVLRCPATPGACTPTQLTNTLGAPMRVAVRGDDVFVLSNTGLYRMGRDGSGLTRLAPGASGGGGFIDLVTDGTTLYWGDGGRVLRCAVAACTPTVIAEVTGQGSQGLALDATSVYWGTADLLHRTGAIRRIAR